jgi:hypothetical protein
MSAFTLAFSIAVISAVASPAATAFFTNADDRSNVAAVRETHKPVLIFMGQSPVR